MTTKTQQRSYVWDRWSMENNLVAEFCAHTGADPGVARNILQAENWDLPLAVKSYAFLMRGHEPVATSTAYRPLLLNGSTHVPPPPAHHVPPLPPPNTRPVLQKADAVDLIEGKKLARGISRATDNVNLVSKARSEFALDFRDNALVNLNQYFIETPVYTFTLPDLTIYPDDFRAFLEKDLIEKSTLASLENSGRLNWWADSGACQRLWPLATSGDGNCLLHAASLGMWGFHDRLLTLRKALYNFLANSECQAALWRRWRWQQTQQDQQYKLVRSETEWQKDWDDILNMASTAPRKGTTSRRRSMAFDYTISKSDECSENAVYESLEEVHVLALAHVLRRPIIVIADLVLKDVNGDALAPIPFGGIYLPLECSAQECHRSPLVLTYDAAHFSALVVMDRESYADKAPQPPAVIPLTDSNHELLPIQFSIDPGEQFMWERDEALASRLVLAQKDRLGLLREYLDVCQVPVSPDGSGSELAEMDILDGASPVDDEELERRLSEADLECDELSSSSDSGVYKSRAAKQLQSVAKQFGSIGKSMSKRIKKNFGKMTRSNSLKKNKPGGGSGVGKQPEEAGGRKQSQEHILCAVLHTERRHEYQEEMVRNYLHSARLRFERERELRNSRLGAAADEPDGPPSPCVSPGCSLYGTARTSYLCTGCYAKQKEHINSPLMARADAAKYGMGRSRFYAESGAEAHHLASKIPLSRAGSNTDQTLYLSKSTFYNDTASPALSRRWEVEEGVGSAAYVAQGDVTVVPVDPAGRLGSPATVRRDFAGFKMHDTANSRLCRTPDCKYFGCPDTDFYCSKCHKENYQLMRRLNIQEMRI